MRCRNSACQQNAYSAEFHGAGATFNVTTKSGGNTFHGSLFEFMRNDAFDSKNFFAVNKEKLERNQFGGTLGGPVMIPGHGTTGGTRPSSSRATRDTGGSKALPM